MVHYILCGHRDLFAIRSRCVKWRGRYRRIRLLVETRLPRILAPSRIGASPNEPQFVCDVAVPGLSYAASRWSSSGRNTTTSSVIPGASDIPAHCKQKKPEFWEEFGQDQ